MDEHEDAIDIIAEEELAPIVQRRWIRRHWVSLTTIIAVAVLSIAIYFSRGLTGDVEAYGYLGVFIIAILGAAVIIVPVPHLPFIFIMGAILNPWLVGLMAGLGEPIGEIPAYMAGFSGRSSMQNRKVYIKLRERYRRGCRWRHALPLLEIYAGGVRRQDGQGSAGCLRRVLDTAPAAELPDSVVIQH